MWGINKVQREGHMGSYRVINDAGKELLSFLSLHRATVDSVQRVEGVALILSGPAIDA